MLGENVGVVEGAYGNGSGYVKIGSVIDVWKAEVETFDEHWYVTAPCGTYVSTHFKPGSNTHVAMDVKVQGASEYWFGCWDGNWDDRAFALGNDGNSVYCGYGSGNTTCGGSGGRTYGIIFTTSAASRKRCKWHEDQKGRVSQGTD